MHIGSYHKCYNSVNYSIQKEQNNSYLMHNYSLDVSYIIADEFIFSTILNYTRFTGDFSDYNENFLIWNASISKQLFKNKRGELTLSIHDLLNQNRNVLRNVYDNTIEDIQNIAVKRFALITFTYNITKSGSTSLFKK